MTEFFNLLLMKLYLFNKQLIHKSLSPPNSCAQNKIALALLLIQLFGTHIYNLLYNQVSCLNTILQVVIPIFNNVTTIRKMNGE